MSSERRGAVLLLPAIMILAAPAAGQSTGQSTPPTSAEPVRGLEPLQSGATSTPIPVPDAPRIVLPDATPRTTSSPRPTRRAPAQPATEPTAETRRPAQERRADGARPSSAPASTTPALAAGADRTETAPEVVASPPPATTTPQAATTPETDVAPVTPTATAPAAGATVAAPETGRAMPFWLWLAVIVVVGAVIWLLRRGKGGAPAPAERGPRAIPQPAEPMPASHDPEPVPIAVPPAPPAAPAPATPAAPRFLERRGPEAVRARLSAELRPLRAGLNLLSATAECELVVTNVGTAPAEAIRIQATLLTAHAGQDADLAAVNASTVVRPATTPFALAPGEARVIRIVLATPRDAIHSMTAANRPMFVPIVAVNILYASADIAGQTARAWALGVERVDSAKLAPFWLDAPPRMFDGIAARPHAVAIER